MLKEQVAKILQPLLITKTNIPTYMQEEALIYAKQIHKEYMTQFNSIVDKLTVIDDEEINTTEINHLVGSSMIDGGDWVMRFAKSLIKQERATQLQHTKKQLLEGLED